MSRYKTDVCLITGLPVDHYPEAFHRGWSYSLDTDGKVQVILIDDNFKKWEDDEFYTSNKHIIAGSLINHKLLFGKPALFNITLPFLKERLHELSYPKSPKEKMDNLLMSLMKLQTYEGEEMVVSEWLRSPVVFYGHYFKSFFECNFYLKTLQQKGLIKCEYDIDNFSKIVDKCSLTIDGLDYGIQISEEGSQSRNCFIAMSFSKEQPVLDIREAIREAILKTGHIDKFIDEQNFNSDQTINDAIIAELKRAKFCIADFTEQKDGVYFESGFALGQGKPVIYTCRKDWFEKSHFDTNHFPHLIYETPDELKLKLIDKIEAWI